ncbi:hypothetical protein GCM10020255_093000 [Rhodococcus baikonurensis]
MNTTEGSYARPPMLTMTGTWLDLSRTSLSKFSSVTSITAPETAETAPSPLVLRGGGGAVARSLKADKSTAPLMAAATADERAGAWNLVESRLPVCHELRGAT